MNKAVSRLRNRSSAFFVCWHRWRSCFTLQLLEERAQDALKFVEASRKLMKGPSEKWEKECKVLSQLTDRHKTLSMKGFNTSVKEAEEKKEKAQREVH